MFRRILAAALMLAGVATVPAAAQIGSGASSNNNGYPIGSGATSNGYGNPGYQNGNPNPGYGYGNQGGNGPGNQQQTVVCASKNFKNTRCQIDTRGGITLVRQQSKADCRQGRSWGFDRDGIWVDNGCAAVFAVGPRHGGGNGGGNGHGGSAGGGFPGGGGGPGPGRVILCESRQYQPARCAVDVYNGAQLVEDISGSCKRKAWGWDRGGVWVNNGCRGRFRVY